MVLTIHGGSKLSGSASRRGCVRQQNKKIKKGSHQDVRFELYLFESKKDRKMMMIAFITMKSALVPLIEGLYFQISNLRFQIIDGLRTHLLLFFVARKDMFKGKSNYVKISSHLLANKCVLCTHIRIHICRNLVHLDYSGPPGVSSRPLSSHFFLLTSPTPWQRAFVCGAFAGTVQVGISLVAP